MNVLILHNVYRQAGGEDAVVDNEAEMLRRFGVRVHVQKISNDKINGMMSSAVAAINSIFSIKMYFSTRKLLRTIRPDVVHVHNFFPLLSPSVFYACRKEKIPVVMTLHNYRILCPTATLFFEGRITERSISHGPWWAVMSKAYRNSYIGTFFLALMIQTHKLLRTWSRCVDTFVALTDFGREKFVSGGLLRKKIVIKPNFSMQKNLPLVAERAGGLYVGRISEEKGVRQLFDVIVQLKKTGFKFKTIGGGPLEDLLRGLGEDTHLGSRNADEVALAMSEAEFLVVPSLWYEGFPMVIVEAYSLGLPVIANRVGSLAEIVEDGVTGLLFDASVTDDLKVKVQWANDNPEIMRKLGERAREKYEKYYSPEGNTRRLIEIYKETIAGHRKVAQRHD